MESSRPFSTLRMIESSNLLIWRRSPTSVLLWRTIHYYMKSSGDHHVRGATTVFAEAGVGRYCARDYDEAKGKLYKRQL